MPTHDKNTPYAEIILATLERVAERVGDPAGQIYKRLFEKHPEWEDLFVMDKDGGVRANMLATSFNCMIGIAEGSQTPGNLLAAARLHHEGYGLQDGDMDIMFEIMRDVFKDILHDHWPAQTETAWIWLLSALAHISQDNATSQHSAL